jgi:hypothetical protein
MGSGIRRDDGAFTVLFLDSFRRIASGVPNVNDHEIVPSNSIVDEVGISGRREHPNVRYICLSSQTGIFRQQATRNTYLSRDGYCGARAVLRNILVDFRDISAGTRGVP